MDDQTYEARIAQAIADSLKDGVDDINSNLYIELRAEQHANFVAALHIANAAIARTCQLRLGEPINLTNIYTFTMDDVDAMPWGPTKQLASRFTVHPDSYTAIAVDNIIFKQLDCGSLTLDGNGYVVDSNTCLYNCVYIWMRAQGLTISSLEGFIKGVNRIGQIQRERGDFGDEFVMKAICNAYHFPICCLWKSKDSQRFSFITSDHVGAETITTSICYLVNELGTVHFKLLIPDL